jgi:hypothetical protein
MAGTWVFLVVGVVAFGGAALRELVRYRALRRVAHALTHAEGGDVILEGTVVFARGETKAMRLEIFQHGLETRNKQGPVCRWTEVGRVQDARPFYVLTQSGSRVRVEPSPATRLADELAMSPDATVLSPGRFPKTDQLRPLDAPSAGRRGVAELSPGEAIWVRGRMCAGLDPESEVAYRGANATASRVLRCVPESPLVVSTVPLEEGILAQGKVHARGASGYVVLLALFCGLVAGPVVDRAFGTRETAKVDVCFVTRGSKGGFAGYHVEAHLHDQGPSGTVKDSLEREVPIGSEVPVLRGRYSEQMGEHATVHSFWIFGTLVALALMLLAQRAALARATPWYLRESLVSVEAGTLAATATTLPSIQGPPGV